MADGGRTNRFMAGFVTAVLKIAALASVMAAAVALIASFASPSRDRRNERPSSLLRVSGGIFGICAALFGHASMDPAKRRRSLFRAYDLLSSVPFQHVVALVREAYDTLVGRHTRPAADDARSILLRMRLRAALNQLTLPSDELLRRAPEADLNTAISTAVADFLEAWSDYSRMPEAVTTAQAETLNRLAERLAGFPAFSDAEPSDAWSGIASCATDSLNAFGWNTEPVAERSL